MLLKTRRCLRCTNDRSWIWWLCDCSCQRRKYTCLQNNVYDEYMKVVGYAPEFYVAHIGNGTTKIDPEAVHV